MPASPTSADPRSRLYECRVRHERNFPKRHRFAYRIFYLALDLDELAALDRRLPFFSVNGANLFALREDDYLPPTPGRTLKARVLDFCARHGVALDPDARVTLLTLPRLFGYAFNPISIYICHAADGTPRGAIAEVTNTYREVKHYFLPVAAGATGYANTLPKHFYVSPFSPLDTTFEFDVREPGDRLAVRIDSLEHGRCAVHTTLTGEAKPLTTGRLLGCLVRHPLVTLRVITLIHWHALRLWLKRVPYFRKAAQPELQRDLHHPHSSLLGRSSA